MTVDGQLSFSDSELVIATVSPVGTPDREALDFIEASIRRSGYRVERIRISSEVLPGFIPKSPVDDPLDEGAFDRVMRLMDAGNTARKSVEHGGALALGIAEMILARRDFDENSNRTSPRARVCYVVDSLKHPDEVSILREIYGGGFFLVAVHATADRRQKHLEGKGMTGAEVSQLVKRDRQERDDLGQQVAKTFHLADFFLHVDGRSDQLAQSIERVVRILFGHPFTTPTFEEYAMFMAFTASLRSADLSRQVGAVVTRNNEILSTGANDCPAFGGGLYWPQWDPDEQSFNDAADGRDYMRGEDSNKKALTGICDEILDHSEMTNRSRKQTSRALQDSSIQDLTEFGRMVHAEMEAILACARNRQSTLGATLFCTTYPCHNCAKHIVASGIEKVVYVEPYEKSRARELHEDSIATGLVDHGSSGGGSKVWFKPFVGVGPRRFFDLFSMKLGVGRPIKRKNPNGEKVDWSLEGAELRLRLRPLSYLDMEVTAAKVLIRWREELDKPTQP